jgi:methylamine--corrinoid protein Co-methyltransferase
LKQHPRLLDVLKRSEEGPIIEESDFERRMVGPTIKNLVEKYHIQYDGVTCVNMDDDLADRVYQAGVEFASMVGVYNQSTNRRITWSRAEIEAGIDDCRVEAALGEGEEQFTILSRKPEDARRVALLGGVVGIPFPEDLYISLVLSFLEQDIFDSLDGPSLETAYGNPIKAGTGWEVLGAWREAELAQKALEIAGKRGTPYSAVELAPTALGGLAGVTWGAYRTFDRHHIAMTSEFKTNNDLLAIITHIHNLDGFIGAYYNPIYGGHVGGAEGVAVAVTAGMILLNQVTIGHTFCTRPTHPFYGCDTTPEILWATSLGVQALTRNTNLMIATLAGPSGGPGTKTMLYENAAFALMSLASGVSELLASHSAGGAVPGHGSGLDARICAEIVRSMPGLTREKANQLVAKIAHLYLANLDKQLIGKPFDEVYDIENIQPTPEWQATYDQVKGELIALGLPLDQFN